MKKSKNRKLKQILPKHAGRDRTGRISTRGRGGRQKRFYRLIDWKRDKLDMKAKVIGIEYDPNRSANIALVEYEDKEQRYILRPLGLTVGDKIIAGDKAPIKPGSAISLKKIPLGVMIHNIELVPGEGGKLARGAGTGCVIVGKDKKYAHLKLPSGELRKINSSTLSFTSSKPLPPRPIIIPGRTA